MNTINKTNTIANANVKAAMTKRGVKPAELKRILNVSNSTVSNWRSGSRPSFLNAKLIAEYLGCSLLFIRGMSKEPAYTKDPLCKNEEFLRIMELVYDKGYMKGSLKTRKKIEKDVARAEQEKVDSEIKLAKIAFATLSNSSAKVKFVAGLIDNPAVFNAVCAELTDIEKVKLYKKI